MARRQEPAKIEDGPTQFREHRHQGVDLAFVRTPLLEPGNECGWLEFIRTPGSSDESEHLAEKRLNQPLSVRPYSSLFEHEGNVVGVDPLRLYLVETRWIDGAKSVTENIGQFVDFESAPGKKAVAKVRAFIEAVRAV